ncbi:MAG: DUF4097 family beta strand repeat-containing protein [Bacillota bacterium]|nr:DUF4097 family beta strand repeat-containing protein [Bacillota bacterium]
MSRERKWIITAAVLLVLGLMICFVAFAALGFDYGKLSTVEYVSNTYDVPGAFRNISIDADIEEISLVLSNDGSCRVLCHEEKDNPHNVSVQGDTLTIVKKNKQKWQFMCFGIITESPEITVYLPDKAYEALSIDTDTGSVDIPGDFTFETISVRLDTGDARCYASAEDNIYIETDTGDIAVSNLAAAGMRLASDTGRIEVSNVDLRGNIDIREDTGRVTMKNVTCRNLSSYGDTGSLVMTNVIASGEWRIERNTGDTELNGCDAENIYIETDTGDVFGTLLSDKVFLTETSMGNVKVPMTVEGGRCEISTNTGDITIEIIND